MEMMILAVGIIQTLNVVEHNWDATNVTNVMIITANVHMSFSQLTHIQYKQMFILVATHLSEQFLPLRAMYHGTQASGHIPEANVDHFGFKDEVELVWHGVYALYHVLCQFHQSVHVLLETICTLQHT
jgi:hypothetical protein